MGRMQREYSKTGCYHIMLRGNERRNIFLDDDDRQRFLETLLNKKYQTELAVYAYCLMDNHIHLVLSDPKNEISMIMKGIATSYAMFFNIKYSRVGHVFQDRFKSEAIEDERYLMAVIRYVHNNPLKAGMAEKHEQYKWSSYNSYLIPEKSKLVDAKYILGIIADDEKKAIEEFKYFLNQEDESNFLDEKDTAIKTIVEGRAYLDNYMAKEWLGVSKQTILADKGNRDRIIRELRANTDLSIRKISELLEINHKVVVRANP